MTVRVVNAARDGIADTERQVIAALRAWDVPGIAVSGAKVPVSGGGSAEADLVVILPNLAVVWEVKGLVKRLGGRLFCPVQGDWSLPGIPGDPVHTQAGGNPREQLEKVMFGFKNFAKDVTEANLYVEGLVVVVPWPERPITLDKGRIPMPTGQDVTVFSADQLRAWADRRAHRDVAWTAARVSKVLEALGFGYANRNPDKRVTFAELTAAGFPITTTAAADPEPAAPALAKPAAPEPEPADPAPSEPRAFDPADWERPRPYYRTIAAETTAAAEDPEPSPARSSWHTTEPSYSQPAPAQYAEPQPWLPALAPKPTQQAKRRQGGQWALAAVIGALWLIFAAAAGALIVPVHPNEPPVTTIEDQPAPTASTGPTFTPPLPAFAPPRAVATPPPCYPLQTGC
ncbi:hypothetical protein ACWEP5_36410 [Nocardia niigatensis]